MKGSSRKSALEHPVLCCVALLRLACLFCFSFLRQMRLVGSFLLKQFVPISLSSRVVHLPQACLFHSSPAHPVIRNDNSIHCRQSILLTVCLVAQEWRKKAVEEMETSFRKWHAEKAALAQCGLCTVAKKRLIAIVIRRAMLQRVANRR